MLPQPTWRNWQTRQLQELVSKRRTGSSPVVGISERGNGLRLAPPAATSHSHIITWEWYCLVLTRASHWVLVAIPREGGGTATLQHHNDSYRVLFMGTEKESFHLGGRLRDRGQPQSTTCSRGRSRAAPPSGRRRVATFVQFDGKPPAPLLRRSLQLRKTPPRLPLRKPLSSSFGRNTSKPTSTFGSCTLVTIQIHFGHLIRVHREVITLNAIGLAELQSYCQRASRCFRTSRNALT